MWGMSFYSLDGFDREVMPPVLFLRLAGLISFPGPSPAMWRELPYGASV